MIHNAQKAEQEGMRAISTVQIRSSVCPECGRIYVSGGTTTTTFVPKQVLPGTENLTGQNIDTWA